MASNMLSSKSSSSLRISSSSTLCESSSSSSSPTSPTSHNIVLSKFSVPFLWEEKPGVSKPTIKESTLSSPSSLKACTTPIINLLYGKSLEYPPLPPPPRLSQSFLSQPRTREKKLLPTHSLLLRRRPHEAGSKKLPSKEEEAAEDPFFLAMKACTKVEKKKSRRAGDSEPEIRGGFDGLQVALRGLFKPTKKGQKSKEECIGRKGEGRRIYEEEISDDHRPARRDRRSSNGEEEEVERISRPNLHTLILQRDKEFFNTKFEESANVNVESTNLTQGHHGSSKHNAYNKREALINTNQGHGKPKHNAYNKVEALINTNQGLGKPKHNAYNVEALINIHKGHGKPKHNANVEELINIKQGYGKPKHNDCDHHEQQHSSKHNIFTDMLGCKALPSINGAAIHPSLKAFSIYH